MHGRLTVAVSSARPEQVSRSGRTAKRTACLYWFCARGEPQRRHATQGSLSALPVNSAVKTLCGCAATVPLPTPNDRVPKSRVVTARCGACVKAAESLQARAVVWDS